MFLRYFSFILLSAAPLTYAGPTYPDWWIDQGVVINDLQPPSAPGEAGYDPATYDAWMTANYAAANIGQAKNLARAAYLEMEAESVGSTGSLIPSMISGFSTAPEDNYPALNLGQLKAIAKPFYDRMHAEDFDVILGDGTVITSGYPWSSYTPKSENYTIANLGQVKHVFSFSLNNWAVFSPPTPSGGYDVDYALVTSPGSTTYAVVGQPVAIEAEASFVGDTVAGIEFFLDGVSLGAADTSSPYQDSWTPGSAGSYLITATAESASSGLVYSPAVSIHVQADGDSDELGDSWESTTGVTSPTSDSDGDGYLASDEYSNGSSPTKKDHPAVDLEFFSASI